MCFELNSADLVRKRTLCKMRYFQINGCKKQKHIGGWWQFWHWAGAG